MTRPLRFDLNLKQLKVFYCAARHLSFTQAAKELFITQPAVTKQVDSLEQYCEARLFRREKKHLALTQAGAVLFRYAEQIMRLAFEADQAVSDLKVNPHGVLRLGTTKTFGRYLLPLHIFRFHETYPKIRIQLDEGSSQELTANVLEGRYDLAVVGRIPYDEGLETIPFPGWESDELVVTLHPGHALAGRGPLTLDDIQDEPLLLREKGSGVRRRVLEQFERRGIRPNILLEAGNVDFIKELIARGAGIGILGRMSIQPELMAGTLVGIPLAAEGFVIYVELVLPREGYRPVAVELFLEFLLGRPRGT